MAIRFRCPHCARPHEVADDQGGLQVRCQYCKQRVIIPEAVPGSGPAGERSESGQPILRHEPRQKEFTPTIGDSENIALISDHIERHLGKVATVYHELVSDLVHIDIHLVEPSADRPFHTLITSGMSDLPMDAPEGARDCRFGELMLSLPADWPLTQEAFQDERNYWPIRCLKTLARFPHEFDTWLWYGHTVPNGDPAEPFAENTELCCSLLLSPLLAPAEFVSLPLSEEKTVWFFSLVPIYAEEMEFKLQQGADALAERLAERDITELLDPGRKNVCRRRRWPF